MLKIHSLAACAALLVPTFALAQSTIDPSATFAYSSNTAWLNLAPSPSTGTEVTESFLAGYAYAANFGWVHLGDGSPTNGFRYTNTGVDYGVNLESDGRLGGMAYAANAGWLNFDWDPADHPSEPRVDYLTGQFSGWAYGANVGWVALSSVSTSAIVCVDNDNDGIGDAWEWRHFGTLSLADLGTDSDSDSHLDRDEYRADTDPNDNTSHLVVTGGFDAGDVKQVTVRFTSRPSRVYQIEQSADLETWTDSGLGIFAPTAGATTTMKSFGLSVGLERFVRVVALKPLQG